MASAIQRKATLKKLKEFFDKEGRVLSSSEYRNKPGTPTRARDIKRIFGSYSQMVTLLRNVPEEKPVVTAPKVEIKKPEEKEAKPAAPKPAKPSPKPAPAVSKGK